MNRGRKSKPSVTFYMRSSEYGDIKILFSYNGERYSGGTTYISLPVDKFALLKPNGEPKKVGDPENPKIANGILVSDLLVFLREYIVRKAEERLSGNKSIDEDFIKSMCSDASKALMEQIEIWSSNLEWNKGVYNAIKKGGDALCEFYRANLDAMFTTLEVKKNG